MTLKIFPVKLLSKDTEMAGISTKGIYGLAAMHVLAEEAREGTMQIKEIAKIGNIPQNYLEQILVVLKKQELVSSIRGAGGGYILAKDPSEITVYEILSVLEGDLCDTGCKTENPVLKLFWADAHEKVKGVFQTTLAEVVEYKDKLSDNYVYHI